MIVVSALKNTYGIFNGIDPIEIREPDEMADFYSDVFANSQKTTIVWQSGLSKCIYDILRILRVMNYQDVTPLDPPVKSMQTRSYKYLISTQGVCYRLIVRLRKVTIYVYNVENLLANLHPEDIISSWGVGLDCGDVEKLVISTFKAIAALGGAQEKRTPFTLSMRSMREWNRIEENFLDPDMCDAFTCTLPTGETLESFIRESYFGGWCYINPRQREDYKRGGRVYDMNSMYPYIMSKYKIPHGTPTYFTGDIPEEAKDRNHYFFIRCRIKAHLKPGHHFPFLRKKRRLAYAGIEYISTTNFIDSETGKEIEYIGKGKNRKPVLLETTLTMTDYYMLYKHYDVEFFEPIDGVYFRATTLMFKKFINAYYKEKQRCDACGDKGGRRVAKMIMNSLSGTLAKVRERENIIVEWNDDSNSYDVSTRETISTSKSYIYMAAAITSYGREIAIETACDNYDNFIYSDTDSAHLLGKRCKNILLDDGDGRLGAWKVEKEFSDAYYFKAKTYILHCDCGYKITMAGVSLPYKQAIEAAMGTDDAMKVESLFYNLDKEFYQCRKIEVDPDDPDYTIDGDSARDPFDGEYIESVAYIDYPWKAFITELMYCPDKLTILGYIPYPTGIDQVVNFRQETYTEWITLNKSFT